MVFFPIMTNTSCQILPFSVLLQWIAPRRVAAPSGRQAEGKGRHHRPRLFRSSMFMARIFSRLSVRGRIIVLGIIALFGFLATGVAFVTGDAEVGRAFETVRRDADVADSSRDLKAGLLMMRAASTEFVAHPSDTEVKNFYDGQKLAMT